MICLLPLFFYLNTAPESGPLLQSSDPALLMRNDNWFSSDKLVHFTTSAWLATWGITYLQQFEGYRENRAVVVGGLVTLGIGIAKELYDCKIRRTFFSYKDLTADILGIIIIVLLAKGL